MATTGEIATGTITIEYNTVTVIPGADGDVWMTPSEIARMFEVFVSAVTSNIRDGAVGGKKRRLGVLEPYVI